MKTRLLKLFSILTASALLLTPVMVWADDVCHCPDCVRERESVRGDSCCHAGESCCCCREANVPTEGLEGGDDFSTSDNDKDTESKNHDCQCCLSANVSSGAIMPVGEAGRATLLDVPYQHAPVNFERSGWVYQILHPPR